MKKIIALLLCLTLCALPLVGCNSETPGNSSNPGSSSTPSGDPTPGGEPTDGGEQTPADPKADLPPAERIVDSYYSYSYTPSGSDLFMTYFFHFYPEIPGLGAVYYAGFAMNQITFSGTYEVVEQESEYACWPDRAAVEAAAEGAAPPTGTAPYTINFYDMDGNLVDSCGFDGDKLYQDMAAISGIGGENAVYDRDTDPENSALAADYNAEKAVPLLSLVDPNDETATLELLVNGKYNDAVIMFVGGTYSMNADQTEITLTPDSSSDNGATVTKNADGTYTYKSTDGTEVIMNVVGAAKNISYLYKGEVPVPGMEDTMGDLICELYDDGSARLYASAFGTEFDIDAATYDVDMTTFVITLHFETAGDIATVPYGISFDYSATGIDVFGEVNSTLSMVTD